MQMMHNPCVTRVVTCYAKVIENKRTQTKEKVMNKMSVRVQVNGRDEWFVVNSDDMTESAASALAHFYYREIRKTTGVVSVVEVLNMTSDDEFDEFED